MKETNYQAFTLTGAASNFADKIWQYTNDTAEEQRYTILPDGLFDLIVTKFDNRITSISLFGLCVKEMEVTIAANTTVVGVLLKPLAAEYIIDEDIAGLLNGVKPLPHHFWELHGLENASFNELAAHIARKIAEKIVVATDPESRKLHLFELLNSGCGAIQVQQLSRQLYWPERQMNRYFKSTFGLSVKAYSNILRCFSAYKGISNGDLAPGEEFYDRSHFIKEIKKHTGSSPSELKENKNDRFLQFNTYL